MTDKETALAEREADGLTVDEILCLEHRILIGVGANGSAAGIERAIIQLRYDMADIRIQLSALLGNVEALAEDAIDIEADEVHNEAAACIETIAKRLDLISPIDRTPEVG